MSAPKDLDRQIESFLADGPLELPEPSYAQVRDRMDSTRQRAGFAPWRTSSMSRIVQYGLAAAAAVLVIVVGFGALRGGPAPGTSPSAEPSATAPSPSGAFDDVLNAFLAARVAGAGAQQYLDNEQVVPLLYATTSGAPYERAEFEPVVAIEWPYGLKAFKVRLFAGDTVVEQLFFAGPDAPLLSYELDGFGTDIAPTTENGQPVTTLYTYFDGSVTLQAAHPWIFPAPNTYPNPFGRLIPEGPGVAPTTDGGQRHDGWDRLVLMADPTLGGAGCQKRPDPADAAALAESIRSRPDLGATAPVAVRVGGAEALMMDVVISAGATISVPADAQGNLCNNAILGLVFDQYTVGSSVVFANGVATGRATGDSMRLYLLDVPEGSSMRILAIAIVAPESRFERAMEAATPVLDSVEFHAP